MVLTPDAVVMEMEKLSAAGGPVTMEIPEESAHRHARRRREHRVLVAIGEISTCHQLAAAKEQITRGEWGEEEEEGGRGGGHQ